MHTGARASVASRVGSLVAVEHVLHGSDAAAASAIASAAATATQGTSVVRVKTEVASRSVTYDADGVEETAPAKKPVIPTASARRLL